MPSSDALFTVGNLEILEMAPQDSYGNPQRNRDKCRAGHPRMSVKGNEMIFFDIEARPMGTTEQRAPACTIL